MDRIRAKKHLGQHFLKDLAIAEKIASAVKGHRNVKKLLEIGPGMGVMTDFLMDRQWDLYLIDIDKESIEFLNQKYPLLGPKILEGDFLKFDFRKIFPEEYIIVGNFPYNISSQIFFRVLQEKNKVVEVVCMLQKEVAERLASGKGTKAYGILSVLLQAYYSIEYLFTVPPEVFDPAPKVNSGVIRLVRNEVDVLDCDEKLFFRLVKQAFSTRRKTLRNALKPLGLSEEFTRDSVLDKRAEQLDVADFISLTKKLQSSWKQ